jgi:hypothetical protein
MNYFICFIVFFLVSCACQDPRGCNASNGIGNAANRTRLVQEGRDYQTYQNTKMPLPPSNSDNKQNKMPQLQINHEIDSLVINDRLDLNNL